MNVQDSLADRGSIKADFAALSLGKGTYVIEVGNQEGSWF